MQIDFGDSVPDWRAEARGAVEKYFSLLASVNLHCHLVRLRSGARDDELDAAEIKRQQILSAIDAAQSPDEVEAVLDAHGLALETAQETAQN